MKIAVLAEQNINLIDGSTIWLLNTCRLLTACQGFEVFLLSPHTLIDRTLVDELPKEVSLCHPCDLGAQSVSVSELTSALEAWEQRLRTFDRIYVRGQRFLASLLGEARFWDRVVAYVPGILPRLGTDWPDWINQAKSHRTCLVVQSETAKRVLESLLDYPASCIHVVPPVVFPQADLGRNAPKQTDLVYAGKIDKEYGLEWFQALVREMGDDPDLRAVLIAGKDTGRSGIWHFFALLIHCVTICERILSRVSRCLRVWDMLRRRPKWRGQDLAFACVTPAMMTCLKFRPRLSSSVPWGCLRS